MRLNRYMAQAGVASRRHSEAMIVAGRVKLNGEKVVSLATRVHPDSDVVTVDDRTLEVSAARKCYLLNKPAGYLTTLSDPFGRPTVASLIGDIPERVFPVGRLDRDSEGLLLLTNDGALSHRLMHPRFRFEKEYHVLVKGVPREDTLQRLREGVMLDGRTTAKAGVESIRRTKNGNWLSIVLHEGRKRQIRRMCDMVGHPVTRLIRVRLGGLADDGLPAGKWRTLTHGEIEELEPVDSMIG
ncbi:MAG: rRNA pseudouridine synthase [Gemmatimonadetes bacterium]|nr:rRNA pseudouridine synthase [Gemmatimonadota bacterium]